MRAASRRSYESALERLNGYASQATPEQLRTLADELLEVAGLLAGEIRLRRALSDPARSGDDRVALLRGLLGGQGSGTRPAKRQGAKGQGKERASGGSGRVGAETLRLLEALVSGRWSGPSELLDACEQLGVQALLASAERVPDGAGSLADVEDELFRFSQLVAGDAQLRTVLGDRSVPAERRVELARSLLDGKASPVTVDAVRVAVGGPSSSGQGFGGRNLEAGLARLVELAAQRRDRSVAYVTVAAPIDQDDERRLGAALSARYGRDISVRTVVDPRVLGGARVRIGSDLYDGTVARRLAEARSALVTR